jgi:hypothetical protein
VRLLLFGRKKNPVEEMGKAIASNFISKYNQSYKDDRAYYELIGLYEHLSKGNPELASGPMRQSCVDVSRYRKANNMPFEDRFLD